MLLHSPCLQPFALSSLFPDHILAACKCVVSALGCLYLSLSSPHQRTYNGCVSAIISACTMLTISICLLALCASIIALSSSYLSLPFHGLPPYIDVIGLRCWTPRSRGVPTGSIVAVRQTHCAERRRAKWHMHLQRYGYEIAKGGC
jgi:hypothetical protein